MYNPDILYKRTAQQTDITAAEAKSAVLHYFKTIRQSVKQLEAPAYYLDFIGTIYARKSNIEKEMKKLIQLYRYCKRFYNNNPVRHNKIITYAREEITRLNYIRHQLEDFYAEKKNNRDSRAGKTVLATQMGYYRGGMAGTVAENNQEQSYPGQHSGKAAHL